MRVKLRAPARDVKQIGKTNFADIEVALLIIVDPGAQERGEGNKKNKNNSLSILNSQLRSKTTKRKDGGYTQRQIRFSFLLIRI